MLRYNNEFFGVVSLFIYISSNIPINSKLRYKKEDCWITEFEMVCLEGWPHRRVSTRQDCPRCTGKLSVIVLHWHKKKNNKSERSQSHIKMTPESCGVMKFARQGDSLTNAQMHSFPTEIPTVVNARRQLPSTEKATSQAP